MPNKVASAGAIAFTVIVLAGIMSKWKTDQKKKIIESSVSKITEKLDNKLFIEKHCKKSSKKFTDLKEGKGVYDCLFLNGSTHWTLEHDKNAIKVFKDEACFQRELDYMRKIQNIPELENYIPHFKGIGHVSFSNCESKFGKNVFQELKRPYLWMEKVHGTLFDVFKTQEIEEDQMITIATMILGMIYAFCSKGVQLTDVRLENIFWRRNEKGKIELGFLDSGEIKQCKKAECVELAMKGLDNVHDRLSDPNETLRRNKTVFGRQLKNINEIAKELYDGGIRNWNIWSRDAIAKGSQFGV